MSIKVLAVKGSVSYKDGESHSTLPEVIEEAVEAFTKTLNGKITGIDFQTDFGSLTTGGRALILIQYEGTLTKPGRPPIVKK